MLLHLLHFNRTILDMQIPSSLLPIGNAAAFALLMQPTKRFIAPIKQLKIMAIMIYAASYWLIYGYNDVVGVSQCVRRAAIWGKRELTAAHRRCTGMFCSFHALRHSTGMKAVEDIHGYGYIAVGGSSSKQSNVEDA